MKCCIESFKSTELAVKMGPFGEYNRKFKPLGGKQVPPLVEFSTNSTRILRWVDNTSAKATKSFFPTQDTS